MNRSTVQFRVAAPENNLLFIIGGYFFTLLPRKIRLDQDVTPDWHFVISMYYWH